jgi:hypothetical protein
MSWDISDDKLVSDIACMFFDAQTVKSVPSDYARSVIAAVREHDAAKRPKRDGVRTAMDVALECEARLDTIYAAMTTPTAPAERLDGGMEGKR